MINVSCGQAQVLSSPIAHVSRGGEPRAVSTAEEAPADFHAMSDHLALAMLANRGDSLNRAFEAVERMLVPGRNQFKSFVVVVTANFTRRHFASLLHATGVRAHVIMLPLGRMRGIGRGSP